MLDDDEGDAKRRNLLPGPEGRFHEPPELGASDVSVRRSVGAGNLRAACCRPARRNGVEDDGLGFGTRDPWRQAASDTHTATVGGDAGGGIT